jgi:hypothetical protein
MIIAISFIAVATLVSLHSPDLGLTVLTVLGSISVIGRL